MRRTVARTGQGHLEEQPGVRRASRSAIVSNSDGATGRVKRRGAARCIIASRCPGIGCPGRARRREFCENFAANWIPKRHKPGITRRAGSARLLRGFIYTLGQTPCLFRACIQRAPPPHKTSTMIPRFARSGLRAPPPKLTSFFRFSSPRIFLIVSPKFYLVLCDLLLLGNWRIRSPRFKERKSLDTVLVGEINFFLLESFEFTLVVGFERKGTLYSYGTRRNVL